MYVHTIQKIEVSISSGRKVITCRKTCIKLTPCYTYYTTAACEIMTYKFNILYLQIWYICQTKPKIKNSLLFTELFQWAKRCAGKIPEYGGKNKSCLLAEKKPAYGRIKDNGQ